MSWQDRVKAAANGGWDTKAKEKHVHVPPPPKKDAAAKPPPDRRKK